MNTDMSYCDGKKPFDKCKTCKRFLANYTPKGVMWMVEPCEYLPMEE